MDKKSIIISIVISASFLVISLVLVLLFAGGGNKDKIAEIKASIVKKEQEISDLKAVKDVNGYTPTDVVKAFLSEVKAGKTSQAKLYVGNELAEVDFKNLLKVGDIVTNITFGDALQNVDGDEAEVTITIIGETDEDEFTRSFIITKIDAEWKIVEVVVE